MLNIILTVAEARGLLALAENGAGGLLSDDVSANAYIGDKKAINAAVKALEKLRDVVYAD